MCWKTMRSVDGAWQFPAQRGYGQNSLCPIGDVQRLENCRHVIFHGRLGQVERAANQLVTLALHHERQDLDLSLGKTEFGWRWPFPGRNRMAGFGRHGGCVGQYFRRNVDAACKNESERTEQHFT